MRLFWLLVLVLGVTGCASTKSGIEKQYDVTINVSGGSMAEFVMGVEADTEGTTTSGDAPSDASVDPAVALGMQGSTTSAAAKGAEQLLEDIVSRVEAWQKSQDDNRKSNSDNTTTTTETTNNETNQPVVPDGDGGVTNPVEPPATDLLTFDCSGEMTYRDENETVGIPQKICMLDTWDKCDQIPFQPFTVTWYDSTGNTRSLNVPDKCGIAMLSKSEGYGKFRYEHDKPPFKPVTYAPRGFNATRVVLSGK